MNDWFINVWLGTIIEKTTMSLVYLKYTFYIHCMCDNPTSWLYNKGN